MVSPTTLARARHLIAGEWVAASHFRDVMDPYRGEVVGQVPEGSAAEMDAAIAAAKSAAPKAAQMPARKRADVLRRAAALLDERAPAIARLMARETGKALKDASAEVDRSRDTLLLSAEEAIRIEGSHIPLDGSEMGNGKIAISLRYPVGVVAAITPFNAPFNLACHKLAPSFAAGNSTVLKAPPQAALVVEQLVALLHDAGVPSGVLNLTYGGAEIGRQLVCDPRVDFITFTGSSRAGAEIKANSGLRRVALELGGNGPTIVHQDADVDAAAAACARSAVRLAGQSCISVQSIYAHESIAEALAQAIARGMQALKVGDPLDATTDIGTLIDEAAARRVEQWVQEAVDGGAKIVTGGQRTGAQFTPTLLTHVKPEMKVVCDEIFGPVASIIPYQDLADPIAQINASAYGLQCGLFTQSNTVTFRAIREIRTGALVVGGTSTWRTDQLAYGGIKASGYGREGPRYAIRDMTDERLVIFNI